MMISFSFFISKLQVTSPLTCMENQQKYKMNFYVPESLGSKKMRFLQVHTRTSLYNSPFGPPCKS